MRLFSQLPRIITRQMCVWKWGAGSFNWTGFCITYDSSFTVLLLYFFHSLFSGQISRSRQNSLKDFRLMELEALFPLPRGQRMVTKTSICYLAEECRLCASGRRVELVGNVESTAMGIVKNFCKAFLQGEQLLEFQCPRKCFCDRIPSVSLLCYCQSRFPDIFFSQF